MTHSLLIGKIFRMASEQIEKESDAVMEEKSEQVKNDSVKDSLKSETAPMPDGPKQSMLASMYPRLEEIYNKLVQQNEVLYRKEQQLSVVERECAELKEIFKGKQRRELQEKAERLKTQIANMKQHLSHIVQEYGFKNVKEFLAKYRASKAEFNDYQSVVVKWNLQNGEEAKSESELDRL